MKYKLLRTFSVISNVSAGETLEIDKEFMNGVGGLTIPVNKLIQEGFIEEVKETPKPRWKVGDYVVTKDALVYRKISTIFFMNTQHFVYDLYKEEELRDPTPEELNLYFR